MLLRRQNQSRKRFLEEALLMCRVQHEKGRKAVEMNRGILRDGETAT